MSYGNLFNTYHMTFLNLDINEAMPLFFTAMAMSGMKVYG